MRLLVNYIFAFFASCILLASYSFDIQPAQKISLKQEQRLEKKHINAKNHRKLFKRSPRKTPFFQRVKKWLKRLSGWKVWLYIISGLAAIILGLIAIGASVWLILGVVIGLLLYLIFIGYLFYRFIDNGFSLEWFWWLILALIIAGTAILLTPAIGFSGLTLSIIVYMLWFALGLAALVFVVFLIISFFKALFSPFTR